MPRNRVQFGRFKMSIKSQAIAYLSGLALIASTGGCQRTVKDERALAQIHKVAVDVYVDETFSMDGKEFAWFSARFPLLFSTLLKDTVEAVDNAIGARESHKVSFVQIKSLHKDPTSALAENPSDLMKSRFDETRFRNEATRRDLTPELTKSSGSDGVLWVHVRYSSRAKPPTYEADHGQLTAPGISWDIQLFNQSGQKIWAETFRKTADEGLSIGSWTQEQSGTVVTTSLSLDQPAMVQFSKDAATELAAKVFGSLTEIIVQARGEK